MRHFKLIFCFIHTDSRRDYSTQKLYVYQGLLRFKCWHWNQGALLPLFKFSPLILKILVPKLFNIGMIMYPLC